MKNAQFALSTIALLSFIGMVFAFKAAKRGFSIVYTTNIYNATATKTLTCAITSILAPTKYYTFIDNQKAILRTPLTKAC